MSKPKHTEWGKLNSGQRYGIEANDVRRALACARLGDYEQMLIAEVKEESWGVAWSRKQNGEWPDPVPARIKVRELARKLGVPAQRIAEAKRSLLESHILIESEGGLLVNKNAPDWTWPRTGEKRLTAGQLARAEQARSRHAPALQTETKCNAPALQSVTLGRYRVSRPSVTAPIEKRAHVLEEEREKEEPPSAVSPTAARKKTAPAKIKGISEVAEAAERIFPGEGFGAVIEANGMDIGRSIGGGFEQVMIAAMEKAARGKGRIDDLYTYVLSIAKQYRSDGIPPAPVSRKSRNEEEPASRSKDAERNELIRSLKGSMGETEK